MTSGYIPSQTLPGDAERIREHSFTRWMSRDLLQAATDFCKNLGLVPIYAECGPNRLARYLFWRPPEGSGIEVRSGRTLEQFKVFDQINNEKGRLLLSLHLGEGAIYSAVWISREHYEAGVWFLGRLGITPAGRNA
jgi:hypothetical protein